MTDPVPPDRIRISIRSRGPYVIEGPAEIRDAEGNRLEPPPGKNPNVIKLCGCGRSLTRPFCDGSHKIADPPPSA
jgi:CDGSH-type Zn-finger protein